MGQRVRVSEERRGINSNSNSSVSEVIFRPLDRLTDWPGLIIEFDKYWKEVHREDINEIVVTETLNGEKIHANLIEGHILHYLYEDKCQCRIAEHKGKIIGFMFYGLIFDTILIVRAVYFNSKYQKAKLLRKMMLDLGPIRRIFSQTHTEHQPKNIRGESATRKKIYSDGKFDLWENIVRDTGHYQNKHRRHKWVQAEEEESREVSENRPQKREGRQDR